jgi:hypothetical protein
MKLFEKIEQFIDSWELRDFYIYVGSYMGAVLVCTFLLLFYYYSSMHSLRRQLEDINDMRENTVRSILTRAQQVRKQKEDVDAMLAQEPDFKIGGYFKDLLTRLDLGDKKEIETTSSVDRDEKYKEDILRVRLVDMNMQQLAQLLNEIEQNKRIYSKELEITKSQKRPDAIEASITIATLQPKATLAV